MTPQRWIAAAVVVLVGCSQDPSSGSNPDTRPAAKGDTTADGPVADVGTADGSTPVVDAPAPRAFALPAALDLDGDASSVAVADLDGDGYRDLVALVAREGTTELRELTLVVAWGDAEGNYAQRFTHALTRVFWTRDSADVVAVGDWDGDQRLDVATASGVALGQGDRDFAWQALADGEDHALLPVALVDLEGSGDLTLLRGTTRLQVERCTAAGDCQPLPGQDEDCPTETECAIEDLVLGDFDRDGKPDILAGGPPVQSPFVERSWLWRSSDGWSAPVTIERLQPVDFEVADVDGDGFADLVAQVREFISDFPAYTQVWLGDPTAAGGLRHVQTVYNFDNHNDNAEVADMDGDHCPDLMMIGVDTEHVGLRRGTPQDGACSGFLGSHDPSREVDAGGWEQVPYGVMGAIGIQQLDVNGDDRPDWVLRTGSPFQPDTEQLTFISPPDA